MTREEFDALVSRLERASGENPRAYKVRVAAFAALGYAYLLGMLAFLLLLLAGTALSVVYLKAVGVKLLVVLGPFVWLVARSLWVEVHAPVGHVVTPKRAPELFAHIERLRKAIGAPRFHRVVVDEAFNASVVQVPRLGLFGWHRNYLVLGFPLLKSLTPEQFDAVLAHELGHLAGGHARFSNWLYRLRTAWDQLREELARTQSSGAFLFKPFIEWYAPRFSALTFPLARANEYEADAASARVTSPRAAAEALTGVNVIGSYFTETFWPRVYKLAEENPQPAGAPYTSFGGLHEAIDPSDSKRWLDAILARKTTSDDTHPALGDRLRAIGADAAIAPPADGAGADGLLGDAREDIAARLDRRWEDRIFHDWRKRYDEVQSGRSRLAELAAIEAERALTTEEAIQRAELDDSFGAGRDAAIAQLRAIREREPEHAVVTFLLGARLLAADDAEGVALVERAMGATREAIGPGHELLRDYFWRRGEQDRAREHHAKLLEHAGNRAAATAERQKITIASPLDRHGLDAEAVAALAAQLRALGVRKAWLARKRPKHDIEQPLYLLGFSIPWRYGFRRKARAADLQQRILASLKFPGETFVICVDVAHGRFRRNLRRLEPNGIF